MPRITTVDELHPWFRAKVVAMMADLSTSPHDWQIFETLRPIGDSPKCGTSSTSKANPCINPTRHAYGAAVDVVPHGTWGPKGAPWRKASWPGWDELREAAKDHGLSNDISWDRPHVETSRANITRWLQSALGITVDGKWGPQSHLAAKTFAMANGIPWREPIPKTSPRVHPATYRQIVASGKWSNDEVFGAGIAGGAAVAAAFGAWWLISKGA